MELKIIGGGLAGCEAAWQAANRGIKVKIYDMKPKEFSPAHTNKDLCELVCSNSLKGNGLDNACGLLKEEMRRLDSLVIKCADKTSVPAGGALAVDRHKFAALVTENIKNHPNIIHIYWIQLLKKKIHKKSRYESFLNLKELNWLVDTFGLVMKYGPYVKFISKENLI